MKNDHSSVKKRSILSILKDSLNDCPMNGELLSENEVRYKIVIDPSEDGSIIRLLFSLGVLYRKTTKIYVCSEFPGDHHTQKVCADKLHVKNNSCMVLGIANLY